LFKGFSKIDQISTDNRIIGEFLGYEVCTEDEFLNYKVDTYADLWVLEYLKFHDSWDSIMPVVKKIREIINVEFTLTEFDSFRHMEQRLNGYTYDIESIVAGCVEFIKTYNHMNENKS
jgi:uncharacterized protein YfbU (UPF0304 family)